MLLFHFYYLLVSHTVYPSFIINIPSVILALFYATLFSSALLWFWSCECPFCHLLPSIRPSIHSSIHSAEQVIDREGGKGRWFFVSSLSLFDCSTVSIWVIEPSQTYSDLMRQQLTTSQSCVCGVVSWFKLCMCPHAFVPLVIVSLQNF